MAELRLSLAPRLAEQYCMRRTDAVDVRMNDTYFVGWDGGLDGEERSVVVRARSIDTALGGSLRAGAS